MRRQPEQRHSKVPYLIPPKLEDKEVFFIYLLLRSNNFHLFVKQLALHKKLYRDITEEVFYETAHLKVSQMDHPLRETSGCVEDAFILIDDLNKVKEELYFETNQSAVT
jgi:hypothetical protein